MKRIMVVGVSSGAGKSTLARSMGEKLDIPVHHLDVLHWKPGWQEASREEFTRKQQEIVNQETWIIEGNYSTTYDIRAARADAMIYIELPLHICLYRVVKRWWLHRGRTRPDIGEGCEEKLDASFLKFILTTYYTRKKKMRDRFQAFQKEDPSKTIILLRSKQDVEAFLKHLDSITGKE